jgi:hypothetical protein
MSQFSCLHHVATPITYLIVFPHLPTQCAILVHVAKHLTYIYPKLLHYISAFHVEWKTPTTSDDSLNIKMVVVPNTTIVVAKSVARVWAPGTPTWFSGETRWSITSNFLGWWVGGWVIQGYRCWACCRA